MAKETPSPKSASEKPAKADKADKADKAAKSDKAGKATKAALPIPPARLHKFYREKVVPDLMQKFGYKSVMQVPRLRKITLNMGVGEALGDKKILDNAVGDMTRIAGQKPVVTKARKSIAAFKVRAGFPIGCMVTLRGARMYEFLDRLVNIAIPRIRDFRGVSGRAFDGRGNYSLGLTEQLIFPEVSFDNVDRVRGMQVNIITSAATDEEGKRLLDLLGMPFVRSESRI